MADFNPDEFLAKTAPATQAAAEPAVDTKDFNPDEFLSKTSAEVEAAAPAATAPVPEPVPAPEGAAPAFYVPGETGINWQATRQAVEPMVQAAKNTYQAYKGAGPAIIDVGAIALGSPLPPYATLEAAKGLQGMYGAAKESMAEVSKLASQFADRADVGKYTDLWKAANKIDPTISAKISQINAAGGGNAVAKWLTTTPEGIAFLYNPETSKIASQFMGAVPSTAAQVGRVVGPALKGLAKVAGPVATAYDVYEAGQMARETQLGERLARGQGQFAPQAARDVMLNRNVSGYQPTPQEAANLLASGDQRTIQIYGGAKKLAEQAGQVQARPAQPSFIDNAMNVYQRYRGVAR